MKAFKLLLTIAINFNFGTNIFAQSKTWLFQGEVLTFNPNCTSTSISYPGAMASGAFSANCIHNENSNLMFAVTDGIIFDDLGNQVSVINNHYASTIGSNCTCTNAADFPLLYGYPEYCIVPVPGQCMKYFIISAGASNWGCSVCGCSGQNLNCPDPGIGNDLEPMYVTFDANTMTLPSNVAQTFVTWTSSNPHNGTLQLAATKLLPCQNNKRFLFVFEGENLYRYDITSSGIGNEQLVYSATFGNYSSKLKTEMEIIELAAGGYKLAVPFNGGTSPYSQNVMIINLDQNGDALGAPQFVQIPATAANQHSYPKGIEFSQNGDYIYVTSDLSPYIYNINTSTGTILPLSTSLPNLIDFQDSQIEVGCDGKMFFSAWDRLASLSNPDVPNSANWTDPGPNPLINFLTTFCLTNILPDQIDGENYLYRQNVCITQPQAICAGSSITINATTGFATYQWFINSVSQGVSFNPYFNATVAGDYYVIASYGTNCRGLSNTVHLTVNPSPVAALTINPGNNICAGSTATLNVGSCGGCTYVWHDQNGVIAGATSSSYVAGNAGSYYVVVTNSYGCPAQSNTQVITIIPGCCIVGGATTLNNHVVPTGTTENYSGNVVINGTFSMDLGSTVNFSPGCIVTLSANAKINVVAATLNINQATLKACYYMWDGIYLNNVGFILPHLNIYNNSSISDAVYAVHTDNAADIHIDNSIFDRNYIALHLYTADYSACNVSFNTFSCSSVLNPTTSPAPPVGGGFTYAHADVFNLTNSLLFDHNDFVNGDYGIYTDKSTVTVSPANSFTDHRMAGIRCIKSILTVNDKNSFLRCPAGINATDFSNISVFDNNDFIECNAGVYCNNYVETYVDDNTFRRNWIGVYLFSSLQTITVTHNRIYDPKAAAIYSGFNTGVDQIISFNHIRADALPITPNGTYGIYLASNQNNQRTIYVEENVIENYGFGIWCSMNDYPYLHLNTIVLPPNNGTSPIPYRGIFCGGGKGYSLVRNDVTGDDALDQIIAGIHIFNCDKVDELCNTVHTLGNGLLWEGANLGPNVYGNNMSNCDNDLYLLNFPLGLGTQGIPPGGWFPFGIPSDNKWNGNASNQTMGDASNNPSFNGYTNFINRAAPPYYNPTLNNWQNPPASSCSFTNFNFSSIGDICDYVPDVRAAKDDRAEALRIAGGNTNDPDYEALQWLSKKYLYELLNEKPELLTDSVLQNAKDSIEQTPIKNFSELADTIIISEDTMQTLAADTALQAGIDSLKAINAAEMGAANDAVAVQKTAEQNLKDVNGVYLGTIAIGINQLDAMQRFTLEYIASQCPYTGGNAVFTAQNILAAVDTVFIDYSHNCDGITFRKAKMEDKEVKYQTHIYPNPSSGNLNCDYAIGNEESGILILRDVSGRIVKDIELTGGNHSIDVAMDAFEGGVYSCEIYSNGSQIFRDKIILIK